MVSADVSRIGRVGCKPDRESRRQQERSRPLSDDAQTKAEPAFAISAAHKIGGGGTIGPRADWSADIASQKISYWIGLKE